MSNYYGSRKVCLDYNHNEDFQFHRRRVTTLTKTVSIPNIVVKMRQDVRDDSMISRTCMFPPISNSPKKKKSPRRNAPYRFRDDHATSLYKENIKIEECPSPKKKVEFQDLSISQTKRMPENNLPLNMNNGNVPARSPRARKPLRPARPLQCMAELRQQKIANAKEAARQNLFAASLLPLPPSPTTGPPLLAQQLQKLQIGNPKDITRKYRTPEVQLEWEASLASLDRFRPKYKDFKPSPGRCCCIRPPQLVMCRGCGYVKKGNIAQSCTAHPTVKYLNDMSICHKCKAPNLLREYPIVN